MVQEPAKETSKEPAKETSEELAKKTQKRKKETKKKASKAAKKARKLSSSEDGETTPSPEVSGSGIAMGRTAPEQEAADPSRLKSPLPFHEEGPADIPAEMPELETEQEAAEAQGKSQPAPGMRQEEVPMQQDEELVRQEQERLDKLHEIRTAATLAQASV